MFGGQALGWMAGTLIWMPGAPGKRRAMYPHRVMSPSPVIRVIGWLGIWRQLFKPFATPPNFQLHLLGRLGL